MTRRIALSVAVAALAAGACSLEPPLVRSNPFDPWSPYSMTLAGAPDTAYSIGEEFDTHIERTPPIPTDVNLKWEVANPRVLDGVVTEVLAISRGATGSFRVTSFATAEYQTFSIAARFTDYIYEVVVGRNIVVGQRVAALQLNCIPMPCASLTSVPGDVVSLSPVAQDARGNLIRGLNYAMGRSSMLSRDPSVVRTDSTAALAGRFHLTAVAPGTTWVVVTMDIAVDSVQLTVGTP